MASVNIFKPAVVSAPQSGQSNPLLTQKYVAIASAVATDPTSGQPIYNAGDELWEQISVSPNGTQNLQYLNKTTGQVYPKALIDFSQFMQPQTGDVLYLGQFDLNTSTTLGATGGTEQVFGTLADMALAMGKTIPTTAGYCEVYVKQVNENDYIMQSINTTTEGVMSTTFVECYSKAEVDGLQILGVPFVTGSNLTITVKFWGSNPK
jgi:hypothetical protein